MKKIIFLFLFVCCFLLVGCRNTETPTVPTVPTEPTGQVTPTPTPDPTQPADPTQPVDPNAPVLTAGWCDAGYSFTTNASGQYVINKAATAGQWEGAIFDIANYSSSYSAISLKFTSTNVTKFDVELIVSGGQPDWAETVNVHTATLEDGNHEVVIDFTDVNPVSTSSWASVPGYYIKDYQIVGIKFALDTSVDSAASLVKEAANIVISELVFNEVENEPTQNPDVPTEDPVTPPVDDTDPNAPTLAIGWNDAGYNTTVNANGEYVVNKKASAGLWEGAMLDISNYSSSYSAFTVKFTSTNVTKFDVEIIISGGEADWAENVNVHSTTLTDGTHEIRIDFTEVNPVSTSSWASVPGYYIKDYDVVSVKFALDTSVDSAASLVKEDANIVIHELAFEKVGTEETPENPPLDEPTEPQEPDLNAPTIEAGYCDGGYTITNNASGEFVVTKAANAGLWTIATLAINNYTSPYSAFTINFTSTNVTKFAIQLYYEGEIDWVSNVDVHRSTLEDGTHEIYIDFTETNPVGSDWNSVPGYFVKDYDVLGIKISLDTFDADNLINEESSIVIHELTFDKIGTDVTPDNPPVDEPTPENPPVEDEPEEPYIPDPNAPTLSVGYCDAGYSITKNEKDEFVVNRKATAGIWQSATLDISNYTSPYSAFTLKFTSNNVKNFLIEISFTGGLADWKSTVTLHSSTLTNGKHEIYIDFTEVNPVGPDWNSVGGYFIKDYTITGIKFALDTTNPDNVPNKEESITIHRIIFDKFEEAVEPDWEDEVYVPTDALISFADTNASKVITEATFDITQYNDNATADIKPYPLFSSGMCLQRDAINRIWGTATNTNFIAAQIRGTSYFGTVDNEGNFEIYLPKMNAGGPYSLTFITEAGRIVLKNVYVGEVFLCAGQSNMEWQPHNSQGILDDLYSSKDCVNDQIRMFHITSNPESAPTTEAVYNTSWKGANQTSIPYFSAVGYLFGKHMQEELGCPIGLIATPVGGSSIEFWLSEENVNKLPYTPYVDQNNEYNKMVMTPCSGYNGMLYPLTGLNLRGVVWYQGCSNAFGTEQYYDSALKVFISQCREMFNNPQLSFTACELARFGERPYAYSVVNEKINKVASEDPYMVVARNLDLGEWKDIHPKDKHEIGRRAAYETLRVFFKKDKPAPITVTNHIFNADGSVTITLSDDAILVNGHNGFEVCVNGSYSYNCNVTIEGNTLTVTASGEITKVRYGYTCDMTKEIMEDVSKMVTVYDNNGFPLDLFEISK